MYSVCFPHQDLPTSFHMPGTVRDTMPGVAPVPRELTFTMEEGQAYIRTHIRVWAMLMVKDIWFSIILMICLKEPRFY